MPFAWLIGLHVARSADCNSDFDCSGSCVWSSGTGMYLKKIDVAPMDGSIWSAIEGGVSEWVTPAGSDISFGYDGAMSLFAHTNADVGLVEIGFADLPSNVLAHVENWKRTTGTFCNAGDRYFLIKLNTDFTWDTLTDLPSQLGYVNVLNHPSLRAVVMHEIGHALGFDDSGSVDRTMYGAYPYVLHLRDDRSL